MYEQSFISKFIALFDLIERKIKVIVRYSFLSRLITSFLIGWAIPLILLLVSPESGFKGINHYSLILVQIWISVSFFFIRYAYLILASFLLHLKTSNLPIDEDNVRLSFYNDRKLLWSAIIIFIFASPILWNIQNFSGLNLAYISTVCLSVLFSGPFWLYFMLNSVSVVEKIIEKIELGRIELFHYDNMWGIKFLSIFSNITTMLWFSSSFWLPFAIDMLKSVTKNPIIQYSTFLFVIIIWIWAFLYPQLLIRKKSIEIKSHLLNEANKIVEERYFSNKEKILELNAEEREKISFYNEQYVKKIESLKVWPFDISWIASFLSSILVPVVIAIITFTLNIKA